MKIKDILLNPGKHCLGTSIGLLLLRAIPGSIMVVAHGWLKLSTFAENKDSFPDPLGVGHVWSLSGAVGAEFFCAALLVLGLGTRLVSIPLVFTMCVAFFIVHGDDAWNVKELAAIYGALFMVPMFTGAGRFSIDALLCSERGYGASKD